MTSSTVLRIIPRPKPPRVDQQSIIDAFVYRMTYQLARDEYNANDFDAYQALSFSVRDRLMERWFATQQAIYQSDAKRVYYLSLEFLLGRLLSNNMINLGMGPDYRAAMQRLNFDIEQLIDTEPDAGLGNGGLGRLAACFLDSAATLSLPVYGYGIRYEYGIFKQTIVGGEQIELPDPWLQYGNPWEIPRPDVLFPVHFYGRAEEYIDNSGEKRIRWVDTQDVYAMAYDILVPGFGTDTVNSLRLWAAKSTNDFDLAKFHAGAYVAAVEDKYQTESISKVLYPPDDQSAGRELRLKQQYFFTSATIQDVMRRFKKRAGRRREDLSRTARGWDDLPDKVAIQLNDTHPAIAIPEMMRVLVDDESLEWDQAWWICQRVFSYTNHTVLEEALESWPSELLGRLLPRHLQIIGEIDKRLRSSVSLAFPGDETRVKRTAIVNDFTGNVRMANLAIVGSHAVNGVARVHSDILRNTVFPEFNEFYPRKFTNKTNGITQRRWLLTANPQLASLITEAIGDEWMRNLDELRQLEKFAEDASFRERWNQVRMKRKSILAKWLRHMHRIEVDPESLFDVQIKRMHEYKRQLLNVLHAIALYQGIVAGEIDMPPRAIMFGGKAAPGYRLAKEIIALIHAVSQMVRTIPRVAQRLTVDFVPDYNVSAAEMLFPATDLSQQISTAGTEASGTGCMKAILNGGVIIGTLDGANIEIRDQIGAENMFIFGHTVEEITELRDRGYRPRDWIDRSPALQRVIETIRQIDHGRFTDIAELLVSADRYFNCADFDSYAETHRRVANAWGDRDAWTRMSILNVARSGYFSSDRTVIEYACDIWDVQPVDVRVPGKAKEGPQHPEGSDEVAG